jgi:hypothetical protein
VDRETGSGHNHPACRLNRRRPEKIESRLRRPGSDRLGLYAQHTHGLSSPPPAGAANFTITAQNAAGRVTAFEVEITAIPPMSNRERLALVSGSEPNDRTGTNLNNNTCIVDRSLTETAFSSATTTRGCTSNAVLLAFYLDYGPWITGKPKQ